jgi:hypothetical protein
MRSAVLAGFLTVLALGASAQMMGGGPQASGSTINMMSTDILVPAAGRGPGAGGSLWRTDLWIKGIAGSTVTLEFHPVDATSDAPTATAQISLSTPTIYLPDVLKSAFNLDQAFGNILLRSSSGVSATARVFTVAASGSYGAGFMGMPVSYAMRGNGGMMDGDDLYQMYVLGRASTRWSRIPGVRRSPEPWTFSMLTACRRAASPRCLFRFVPTPRINSATFYRASRAASVTAARCSFACASATARAEW